MDMIIAFKLKEKEKKHFYIRTVSTVEIRNPFRPLVFVWFNFVIKEIIIVIYKNHQRIICIDKKIIIIIKVLLYI